MKTTGKINKIIKFSNVDGPGNRMAIFFQGCNFNCSYCHNPETINLCNSCFNCLDSCPTGALSKKNQKIAWNGDLCSQCDNCVKSCPRYSSPKVISYSIEELIEEVRKVSPFIRGVTVSGGECTLQWKFITEFFKKVKEEFPNLSCFADTNGGVDLSSQELKDFIEITDSFMLDIKSSDPEEHRSLTGVDNSLVIKNLYFLLSIGKLYEVRTVICNLIDGKRTVEAISKIITNQCQYRIIKYRPYGVRDEFLGSLSSPSNEELEKLSEIAAKNGVTNIIIT